jgi:hypothetical protein
MLYVTFVQLAGVLMDVQLSAIALEEAVVAPKLVGADGGMAMHDVAE